ncbi:MAG TPA: hypothetical protein VJN21_11880 [Candidatus Acidoferrales bacterium]|nr:hypothetical protein [Candidatus Acidoferrales bacterium]
MNSPDTRPSGPDSSSVPVIEGEALEPFAVNAPAMKVERLETGSSLPRKYWPLNEVLSNGPAD